ncbi:unnamed protein product [Musa banksii]
MAVRRRGGECKERKRIKERKGKMRRKEREIRGFLLFASVNLIAIYTIMPPNFSEQ